MKVKTIKSLCGMLAVLAFTACSSNIDESADAPRFYNVTLTASMGDETTRALSEGTDNAIIASFAENDEVVVVDADGSTIVGTLRAQTAGASTTLSGDLNAASLTVGEKVTLRYRSATANYDGQLGTLAGIAANQDYAEGTLTVSTTSPSLTFESNSVTLTAKQSITKFTFKDVSNNADVSVKTFGIAAVGLVYSIAADATETTGAVTGTLTTASSDVYVALRTSSSSQAYSFTVKDNDGNWYTATKNAKLTNVKNYVATVKLTKWIDKDNNLSSSSVVGTIGLLNGLPAIAIGDNKAVALMNVGALCPEAYGTYYTFANRASGLSNGWYVPTEAELTSFKNTYSSTWGAPHGVNGCTFTIGSNSLFLPAAGCYDNDPTPASSLSDVSTFGYYWSSTPSDTYSTLAFRLSYYYDDTTIKISVGGDAKVNAFPVRPFHTLPAQ